MFFFASLGVVSYVQKYNFCLSQQQNYYLAIEPIFVALLLFVPIIMPFPFNTFVALVLTEEGEITWITGTVFPVLEFAEEDIADSTFSGREVVEIVMRFGVELPIALFVVVMTEAAFASNEPVRLLNAGTVVNWIAGADTGIFVMVVAIRCNLFYIYFIYTLIYLKSLWRNMIDVI